MHAPHRVLFVAALGLLSVGLAAETALSQAGHSPCAHALFDVSNPSHCIAASSVPLDGTLLPLGSHWFVLPTGEVGIGTKTPGHRLHVAGDLKVDGRFAAGEGSAIGPNGNWDQQFMFSGTIDDFSSSTSWGGIRSWFILDPSKDLTGPDAKYFYSHPMGVWTEPDNPHDIEFVQGPYIGAFHNGTGDLGILAAVGMVAESKGDIVGFGQAGAYVFSDAYGTGSINLNVGVEIHTGHRGSGGLIDNDYTLYLYSPANNQPLVNHYGIFLEDQDFGLDDSYAIYSDGGKSYFAGNVGIGDTNPTIALSVNGDFAASGTKSFVQPHPYDPSREIWFVCLEGNEAGTYFRGTADLVNGRAEIPVPEEFAMTTGEDGITVQLTAMGPDAGLWVESVDLDRVVVRGKNDVKFSYMVNGIRYGYADFQSIRDKAAPRPNTATRPDPERFRDLNESFGR